MKVKETINLNSPSVGLIQITPHQITLLKLDGSVEIEKGVFPIPDDAEDITPAEFTDFFGRWRQTFRHKEEIFESVKIA